MGSTSIFVNTNTGIALLSHSKHSDVGTTSNFVGECVIY